MANVNVQCAHCEKNFEKAVKFFNQSVRNNWQHFCSASCKDEYRRRTVELPCGTCTAPVRRQQAVVNSSKSGHIFCNKSCAIKYNNRILRTGINHPNYGRQPKTGEPALENYRTICFAYHEKKCIVCGEDKIVEVHHANHNHEDNDVLNLVPLCPTHHKYMHSRHRILIEETVKGYQERMFESLPLLERVDEFDELDLDDTI